MQTWLSTRTVSSWHAAESVSVTPVMTRWVCPTRSESIATAPAGSSGFPRIRSPRTNHRIGSQDPLAGFVGTALCDCACFFSGEAEHHCFRALAGSGDFGCIGWHHLKLQPPGPHQVSASGRPAGEDQAVRTGFQAGSSRSGGHPSGYPARPGGVKGRRSSLLVGCRTLGFRGNPSEEG